MTTTTAEHDLLEAARRGDEQAFERLMAPRRSELHAHCYRMLGSVHDAEDALQEALLRAWRGLGRFEGRSSLRSWLYTIATNTCLNAIERRPKRVLPVDYAAPTDPEENFLPPLVETVWIEPYPDARLDDGLAGPEANYEQRESVELAFVAALQHLPANQRAALILREVLGFSAKEVAEALGTSVPSVNSALQRARRTLDERLPDRSQQATLRELGDAGLRQVVERYIDALTRADIPAMLALLADDANWSMPPLVAWFGPAEMEGFLANGPLSGKWQWKCRVASANGQPAVAAYEWHHDHEAYLPFALNVLTLDGDRIAEVTSFIVRSTEGDDEEYFSNFPDQPLDEEAVRRVFVDCGLPPRLEGEPPPD